MNLMDLVATLKLNVSEFLSGTKQAEDSIKGFESEASAAGQSIQNNLFHNLISVGDAMKELGKQMAIGGAVMSAEITAPMVGVASAALDMASKFEQAEIGFTQMLGSGTKAKQFLDELKAFAASSPFEFKDLQVASQRLTAMGFDAQSVIPIMKTIGDAASAMGDTSTERINRITKAFGDMLAKGKVSAEEMNQLAEANIRGWDAIADSIGVSVPEAMKMAEKGLISASQAIPAILEAMNQKTGGMMAAQVTTIAGQYSNLKDQISFILADLGKALTPFADALLKMASPMLDFLRSLVQGFSEFSGPVQTAIVAFAALAAAAGPLLLAFGGIVAALGAVASAVGVAGIAGLFTALGPILLGVAAAVGLMVAAWEAWKLDSVQSAVTSLMGVLSSFWTGTLQPIVETVGAAAVAFAEFAAGVVGSGVQAAWEGLEAAGAALWQGLLNLYDALTPIGQAFMAALDALSPLLDPVLALAEGLGKVLAVLVTGGLSVAWEVLKAVWEGAIAVVSGLADILGGALVGALRIVGGLAADVAGAFNAVFKPAIEFVVDAVKKFIGVLAEIPGVKQAVEAVGGSFDKMKGAIVGAIDSSRSSIKGLGGDTENSMAKARDALEDARKKLNDVEKAFKDGKATSDQLKSATENLASAHAQFKRELDASQPAIQRTQRAMLAARQEFDAAEKNLAKVRLEFNSGKASAQDYTDAQVRVRTATVNLKNATADYEKIAKDTGTTLNQYSGGIDTVRESLSKKTTATNDSKEATKLHKDATKELEASESLLVKTLRDSATPAVTDLGTAMVDVMNAKDRVKAATDQLRDAQTTLKDALANSGTSAGQLKDAMENLEASKQNVKSAALQLRDAQKELKDAQDAQKRATKELDDQFKALNETLRTQSKTNLPEIGDALKMVLDQQHELVGYTQSVTDAFKTLGVQSSEALANKAKAAQDAYRTIRDSGTSTANDVKAAELAALKATIEANQAAGVAITQGQRDRLEELKRDLDNGLKGQKGAWQNFQSDMNKILGDLSRNIGDAFVDLFSGKGWTGFKDAGLQALKDIGSAIVQMGVDYVEGVLKKHLKDILTDTLPALKSAFQTLGSFLLDLFGGVGSAIKGALNIGTSAASGAAGNVGGVASGTGGGGGVAGSVASAAASQGTAAIVGAIAGGVTAIASVVQAFQLHGIGNDTGRIEENTRYTHLILQTLADLANKYWPKLEGFEQFNYDVVAPALADLVSETSSKLLGVQQILVNEIQDAVYAVRDAVNTALNTEGLAEKLQNILSMEITISGSLDEIKVLLDEIYGKITAPAIVTAAGGSGSTSVNFNIQPVVQAIGSLETTATIYWKSIDVATEAIRKATADARDTLVDISRPVKDIVDYVRDVLTEMRDVARSARGLGSIERLLDSGLSEVTRLLSGTEMLDAISTGFTDTINAIGLARDVLVDIRDMLTDSLSAISGGIETIGDVTGGFATNISDAATAVLGGFETLVLPLEQIYQSLAAGGAVANNLNSISMAVSNLSSQLGSGGGIHSSLIAISQSLSPLYSINQSLNSGSIIANGLSSISTYMSTLVSIQSNALTYLSRPSQIVVNVTIPAAQAQSPQAIAQQIAQSLKSQGVIL